MSKGEEEINGIKEIAELYFDIIENHRDTLMYYLADTATLDWFGQTVKGTKNIVAFIKGKVGKIRHVFPSPVEVSTIGHRDTHIVNTSSSYVKPKLIHVDEPCPQKVSIPHTTDGYSTPSSSNYVEKGQGDGFQNCPVIESPSKRTKLNTEEDVTIPKVTYISTMGHVEFLKKSMKKLQSENKWLRPCKLELACSGTNKKDFVLYLIIYGSNTKCRKNLLKEFDAETSSN